MSSVVVPTSAALRRHFIFDEESGPEVVSASTIPPISTRKSAIENSIVPASRLAVRPAPEMASSGIAELDSLTGGLPRGCITEICGPASSGRTTILLAALAAATRRTEFCALIDACDSLDPHSSAAVGVDLDRMLWVRCQDSSTHRHRGTEKNKIKLKGQIHFPNAKQENEGRLEQVLRATDLLLESGGFGLIALDLADLPAQAARRIPLTTWFRFRRSIEHTPTILLAIEQQPIAGSCSSLLLQFSSQFSVLSSQNAAAQSIAGQERNPSHTQLLTGLEISAELLRSRLSDHQFNSSSITFPNRKPAGSVSIAFQSKTSWG